MLVAEAIRHSYRREAVGRWWSLAKQATFDAEEGLRISVGSARREGVTSGREVSR